MEESNSSQAPRCPCGFWGSSKTSGLCSKCYQDNLEKSKESLKAGPDIMKSDLSKRPGIPSPSSPSKPSSSSTRETSPSLDSALKDGVVTPDSSSNSTINNPKKCDNDSNSESSVSTSVTDNNRPVCSSNNCEPKDSKIGEVTPEKMDNERGVKRDSTVLDESTPESTPEKVGKKNRKRCCHCKVKLELAQREIGRCKCDEVFCYLHRLPEQHACNYDHKEDGRRVAREKMIKPTRQLGTSFKRLDSDS